MAKIPHIFVDAFSHLQAILFGFVHFSVAFLAAGSLSFGYDCNYNFLKLFWLSALLQDANDDTLPTGRSMFVVEVSEWLGIDPRSADSTYVSLKNDGCTSSAHGLAHLSSSMTNLVPVPQETATNRSTMLCGMMFGRN